MGRVETRALLIEQLAWMRETVGSRLAGLTDEEFQWEPVPGCWTVRPRASAIAPIAGGTGDWAYDYAIPDPQPPPFTTIVWRLNHIAGINDMYHEHVFGPATRDYDDVEVPHTAAQSIAWWHAGLDAVRDALLAAREVDLDRVVSTPWGATRKVWDWVSTLLLENVHHGAEIGTLRDLYRELRTAGSIRLSQAPT